MIQWLYVCVVACGEQLRPSASESREQRFSQRTATFAGGRHGSLLKLCGSGILCGAEPLTAREVR